MDKITQNCKYQEVGELEAIFGGYKGYHSLLSITQSFPYVMYIPPFWRFSKSICLKDRISFSVPGVGMNEASRFLKCFFLNTVALDLYLQN